MTEGVALIRRHVFDEVGGWEGSFSPYEGLDLAYRFWSAVYTGWYAASIWMHHPLTAPIRHALFHRLSARNRIRVAYRNFPTPLIPLPRHVDCDHPRPGPMHGWSTRDAVRAARGLGHPPRTGPPTVGLAHPAQTHCRRTPPDHPTRHVLPDCPFR